MTTATNAYLSRLTRQISGGQVSYTGGSGSGCTNYKRITSTVTGKWLDVGYRLADIDLDVFESQVRALTLSDEQLDDHLSTLNAQFGAIATQIEYAASAREEISHEQYRLYCRLRRQHHATCVALGIVDD